MILTGPEIIRQVSLGGILIEPFNEKCVNPNSYNYHLGPRLKIAPMDVVDTKNEQCWSEIEIPEEGFLLEPTKFYLGHTVEKIGSCNFVTSLIGRSSIGRLGLYLQLSADLGHQGAIHSWTLELKVIQPLKVYRGMTIGQVSFWKPIGEPTYYNGIYANSDIPLESQLNALNRRRIN